MLTGEQWVDWVVEARGSWYTSVDGLDHLRLVAPGLRKRRLIENMALMARRSLLLVRKCLVFQ